MYQDLNEHKKSDSVKWLLTLLAFITVGIMLAGIICGWFQKPEQEAQPPTEEETASGDILQTMPNSSSPRMKLSASTEFYAAVSETGQQTVSKAITATVLPEDAPDKSVDWTIEWCEPIEGADISEYLTLTPESDGSLTATLTAYQGFEGASAYVTATTRVGGFSATCLVTYDGAPESFGFIYEGEKYNTTDAINMTAGTTGQITLDLRNTLNAVGSKYGDFEIKSVKGQGRFTMTKSYIVNGRVDSSEEIVFDLGEGTYSYTDKVLGTPLTLTIGAEEFLTASVSDGILTVNAKKSESSYNSQFPRTGYHFKYKGTYTDPRSGGVPDNCKWYVLVADKVSGKEVLINIDIVSTVTDITLSDSVIVF